MNIIFYVQCENDCNGARAPIVNFGIFWIVYSFAFPIYLPSRVYFAFIMVTTPDRRKPYLSKYSTNANRLNYWHFFLDM